MRVVLTIAGSDSSGGAGIQADLKTFEAFGVFGTSAITVVTAQNTTGVRELVALSPSFIKQQIEAVAEDFDIAAVKIGMLYSPAIIETVSRFVATLKVPVVLDPVGISKAGSPLLQEEAFEALSQLFEHVTLLTPNRFEAERLFGYRFGDTNSLQRLTKAPCAVVVKNQVLELDGHARSIDQLFEGHTRTLFSTPHLQTANLHGTGCSNSSAIAANLALGRPLHVAIDTAKRYIYHALLRAPAIGHGPGPINHKAGGRHVAP
ncbi:MAG: bifunctional hydroxymethylpyrimidine kinase/phosphomethylpyrimidine kinase [Campylobacterales bacterium]|nr:bifunctional hydroxymethylpyrimidine kinase/phosphomethylpyrimidine kinase [Campylobacterales bacterium]